MLPDVNYVSLPPAGLVIALQFWEGDVEAAMRLARLLADLEPVRRTDVSLAFCRRFDMPTDTESTLRTRMHCGFKFGVMSIRSRRDGVGHPDGCNGLVAGILDEMTEAWGAGRFRHHSVLLIEADGVPLRRDWLDLVLAEHARSLEAGKRVTGPLVHQPIGHINGTLAMHFSAWKERLSLHHTPSGQAWDLFHAQVLTSEARPTSWIKNVYNAREMSAPALEALARETAWLASAKDPSSIEWAERTLVHRGPGALATGPEGDGDETAHATGMRRVSVRG